MAFIPRSSSSATQLLPRWLVSLVALAVVLAGGSPLLAPPAAAAAGLAVSSGPGVAGTVTGPGAEPVAGAAVEVYVAGAPHATATVSAVTQPDGAYAVDVPAGSYDVVVVPTRDDPQRLAQSTASVTVADQPATKDFALVVGNVRGTVTGSDGAPVDRGEVEATRSGAPDVSVRTYDDGSYRLALPDAATYRLTASPALSNVNLDAPASHDLTLATAGETRTGEDFRLVAPNVRGAVLSPDGSLRIGGSRVVVTTSTGDPVPGGKATTRGNGDFGLVLPPGSYRLQAHPVAPNDEQWLPASASADWPSGPRITFSVTDAHTSAAPLVQNARLREPIIRGVVRTPAGAPVPGAYVYAFHRAANLGPTLVPVDDRGRFMVDMPAGAIWLFAYRPAPTIEYLDVDETVSAPEPITHDLVFRPTNVRGQVLTPDGAPAPGAAARLLPPTGATVDGGVLPDGTFGFRTSQAGEYRLVATPPAANPDLWGRSVAPLTVADPAVLHDGVSIRLSPTTPPPYELTSIAPVTTADGWQVGAGRPVVAGNGGAVAWTGYVQAPGHSANMVVVRDSDTGAVRPLLGAADAFPNDGVVNTPAISADGRFVAFWSRASNLVPDDDQWSENVFVHDRTTGTTTRIPARELVPDSPLRYVYDDAPVALSDDGRIVATVVEGYDDAWNDVRQLELARLSDSGALVSQEVVATGVVAKPALSGDGHVLAWNQYEASNGWTVRVRNLADGLDDDPRPLFVEGDQWYQEELPQPALDTDGSTLAWSRWTLLPGDYGNYTHGELWVADRLSENVGDRTGRQAPVFPEGDPVDEGVQQVELSGDGSMVAFTSTSPLPEDGDRQQTWTFDRRTGKRLLVSQDATGQPADNGVTGADVGDAGSPLAFESNAGNLPGAGDYQDHVYLAAAAEHVPPTWPAGSTLTAAPEDIGSTVVRLRWTAAQDDRAVVGYRVYAGGAPVVQTDGTARSAFVTGLTPETDYRFQVQAFDAAGNQSTDGPTVDVRTQPENPVELMNLDTTTSDGGTVALSWPENTATDVGSLLLVRRLGDTVEAEIPLDATATGYTDSGVAADRTFTYQVVSVLDDGSRRPFTHAVEVVVPALRLDSVDHGATMARLRLAKLGGEVRIVAHGEAGRTVTAQVSYLSWYSAERTLLDAPVALEAQVPLAEAAGEPGTYRGAFPVDEGTAEITGVTATMSDGHGATLDRASPRSALRVSGTVRVTVDAPDGVLDGSLLQIASPTTGQGATTAVTGGTVHSFEDMSAADDLRVTVVDDVGRTTATTDTVTRAGRITDVTVRPTLSARLTVHVDGSDGAPAIGARVDVTSSDGSQFLGSAVVGEDGSATSRHLVEGATVDVTVTDRRDGLLSPGEIADVTLVAGPNTRSITLQGPDRVDVRGLVTRSNGDPAPDTRVVLTETLRGTMRTFSASTGADGRYQLFALAGEATVSADGGSERALRSVTLAGGRADVDLQLTGPRTYAVLPRLYTRLQGAEETGPLRFDWRTAVHLDITMSVGGRPVNTYTLSAADDGLPHVITTARPGDEATLCMDGRREAHLAAACATVVLGDDPSPLLELHVGPSRYATGTVSLSTGVGVVPQARLYQVTAEGNQYVTTAPWTTIGLPLPAEGSYVVDLAYGDFHGRVSFDATGPVTDVGPVTLVQPALFSSAGNDIVAVKRDVLPGGDAEFRLSWHNDTGSRVTDAHALITVPAGTQLLEESVVRDGQPVPGALTGQRYDVPLGDLPANDTGTLRYRLRTAPDTLGGVPGRADLRFVTTGGERTVSLPSDIVRVVGLTFDLPTTVEGDVAFASGRAPAGAVVTVTETGALVAQATAGPGGSWSARLDLGSGHRPGAQRVLTASAVLAGQPVSLERSLVVGSGKPQITQVSMYQEEGPGSPRRKVSFDPRQGIAAFPFVYVPGQHTVVELTFDDPDRVTVAEVSFGTGPRVAAVDPDHDGVFTAGFASLTPGALFVATDGTAKPMQLTGPQPTDAQLRTGLPAFLNASTLVSESHDSTAGSASVTVRVPALGPDATMSVDMSVTKGTYSPTASDVAAQVGSGSPIWGLRVNRVGEWGLSSSAYIPLSELDGADPPAGGWSPPRAPASSLDLGVLDSVVAAAAATTVVRVGFEVAFNGVTAADSAWSAWNADEKYQKLTQALDAATNCGASAGPYLDRANDLAMWAAASDVAGAAFSVASLFLAPATFGLGTIAVGMLGWALDKAAGYAIDQATDKLLADIAADADCEDPPDDDDDSDDDQDNDDGRYPKRRKAGDPTFIFDPSGFTYEGVRSNRVTDATALLLTASAEDGPWTVWDSQWFGQTNPVTTDERGRYGWDVPEGWWKVAYTKEGYEPAYSNALRVLPPHFDVDVAMKALGLPVVESASWVEGQVELVFNRPVLTAAVLDQAAAGLLDAGGSAVPGTWTAVDAENGVDGASLARRFRFAPDSALPAGSTVDLQVAAEVPDYAGRVMAEPFTAQLVVPGGGDSGGSGDEVGVPEAAAGVVAVGGDRSARVSWTASPDNGSAVTAYTVTSSPGARTATVSGGTTSAVVEGLTNGTSYTFTVVATNAVGDSVPSAPSNAVVPAGVPEAATGVVAVRRDRSARVSWTASPDNGSAVTAYTVTSSPGARTATVSGGTTSAVVEGLTNGTSYTFTVVATNAVGDSAPSAPSNRVTPAGVPRQVPAVQVVVRPGRAVVKWKAAHPNGSAITRYEVDISRGKDRTLPASARRTVFRSLDPGRYRVRVAAHNTVGTGPYSSWVQFRARAAAPVHRARQPSAVVAPPPVSRWW